MVLQAKVVLQLEKAGEGGRKPIGIAFVSIDKPGFTAEAVGPYLLLMQAAGRHMKPFQLSHERCRLEELRLCQSELAMQHRESISHPIE